MINIIIADDHQMFIDGIKSLLEPQQDIAIVGEALNGTDLMAILRKVQADIVLMDINMPGMDGVEATRQIRKEHKEVKVLAVTMYNTREFVARLLGAGASGYILKNTGKEELLAAIHALKNGSTYFSEAVTKRIMESLQGKRSSIFDGVIELTVREKEVLKLIALEHTSQEIAKKLFLSVNTIETHRKNLLSKLNLKNTAGLVKYAVQHGVLDD